MVKEAKTLLGAYFGFPGIYFYSFLYITRFPLRVSLYASPLLYKRGMGETREVEARAEARAEA